MDLHGGSLSPADSKSPRVTAILVALGDDPRLPAALASLPAEGVEALVVVNGAVGRAPALGGAVRRSWRRGENPGFAAAFDDALTEARAPYVLSLNPDARLAAGGLEAAVRALDADPGLGAVAFRLERPGGRCLDAAGMRFGFLRRVRDRGMGAPAAGRFTREEEVDGATMACALFRRSALLAARDGAGEVLDRRFFAYKEDVDLSWRLRRAGFRILYAPAARGVHERGWKEGARRGIPARLRAISVRNRWLTILKNETPSALLLRLLPYLLFEAALLLGFLLREPRTLAAYPAILRALPETLRRRPLAARASDGSEPDDRVPRSLDRGGELRDPGAPRELSRKPAPRR